MSEMFWKNFLLSYIFVISVQSFELDLFPNYYALGWLCRMSL
jgi:hypothetical protein